MHPGKQHNLARFRAEVGQAMTDQGWAAPLGLETSPDEAGEGLAAEALAAGVDLLLASGGDATIAACASEVAGSGVALDVLLRRRKTIRLTRLTCRELIVKSRRPRPREVDGEVIGLARNCGSA